MKQLFRLFFLLSSFLILGSLSLSTQANADSITDRSNELERLISSRCLENSFLCDSYERPIKNELVDLRATLRIQAYEAAATETGITALLLLPLCEGFRPEGIAREATCAREWGAWFAQDVGPSLFDAVVAQFGETEALRLRARGEELGWQYWSEAMLAPPEAQNSDDDIIIDARPDGHFWVTPELDGVSIEMMVDTGASGVFLTAEDALEIGVDLTSLSYNIPIMTAAGEALFAQSEVRNLIIFDLHIQNQIVLIAPEDYATNVSLLGMSVLQQFSEVALQGSQLKIHQ